MSVIVVSYNTRDLLVRCLESVRGVHEAIVIDNASNDGSPETVARDFPEVKLVCNATNVGFGRANNQALRIADGDLALLLNSDAAAGPGAIDALAQAFGDAAIVAAGGRLSSADGRAQNSTANRLTLWALFCEQTGLEKLFPRSRLFSPYWTTHRLLALGDGPHEAEQVMGACMMLRRDDGRFPLFDERFFLYCEDTELCHRVRARGKIVYVPGARFAHELGASSVGTRWQSVARYNRGKELYFAIHCGRMHAYAAWLLNRCGAALRLLMWSSATLLTLGSLRRVRVGAATFARVLLAPVAGPRVPRQSP